MIEDYEKDEWKEIRDGSDWMWYCAALDVEGRVKHEHVGTPDRYPCKVYSENREGTGMRGPDQQLHTFIYQVKIECVNCKHSTTSWPEVPS